MPERADFDLTAFETRVFDKLNTRPGHVFTKAELIAAAGGNRSLRLLDSTAVRMRAKGVPIANIWGVGYKLEVDA